MKNGKGLITSLHTVITFIYPIIMHVLNLYKKVTAEADSFQDS